MAACQFCFINYYLTFNKYDKTFIITIMLFAFIKLLQWQMPILTDSIPENTVMIKLLGKLIQNGCFATIQWIIEVAW